MLNNFEMKEKKANSHFEFLFNNKILNSKRSNSRSHFHTMDKQLLKCKRSNSRSDILFNNNSVMSKRSSYNIYYFSNCNCCWCWFVFCTEAWSFSAESSF